MGLSRILSPRFPLSGTLWPISLSQMIFARSFDQGFFGSVLSGRVSTRTMTEGFLSISTRSFVARNSATEQDKRQTQFRLQTQAIYNQALKVNNGIWSGSPSLKSSNTVKRIKRLSKKKEKKDHDWVQSYIKSLPETVDPKTLLQDFAKKSGFDKVTLITYDRLLQVFGMNGEPERAQAMFDLLLSSGLAPGEQTYRSLMYAYATRGELNKTIEIFEKIRKISSNKDHIPYRILIKAYMQHDRVGDAFDVIRLMKERLTPDVSIYNALIKLCIKARNPDRAWAAYDMMLKNECQPNSLTYTMLIDVSQKHDVKKAGGLFDEMLERGITPDTKTINSYLALLCSKPEYYTKAKELMAIFTSQGAAMLDAFTFNIMIKGASINRSLPDARYFFSELQKVRCEPKEQLVYYSTMFDAYASAFNIDETERHTISMPSEDSMDFSFLGLPSPTCIEDSVSEATRILPFLKKIDSSEELLKFNSWTWTSFLTILANYNYFNDAMRWFEIISNNFNKKVHPRSYICILEMCTRLLKQDAFFAVSEKAEALVMPIGPNSSLTEQEKIDYKRTNFLSPDSHESLYQSLILGLVQFDRLDAAVRHFEFLAQEPTIDWKKNEPGYKPFFQAIKESSDSNLITRLNLVI